MNLEETIKKDAGTCADNIWWTAHDKRDFETVAMQFKKQEEIIAKYAGNKPNLPAAAENLTSALQQYDILAANMAKSSGDTIPQYTEVSSLLTNMCANLGIHPLTASYVASWWYNWATAEVARKSNKSGEYERAMSAVFNNLSNEHKVRFGMDSITSDMLANQMQAAGLLSHSLERPELAHRQLVTYYATLFTLLSKTSK